MCITVGLNSQSRWTCNYSCIINLFGFSLLCGISITEIVISFPGILLINLSDLLCCLEKNSREQGGSAFPYLLSLGAMAYFRSLGSRKLENSCLNVCRDLHYWTTVNILKAGSPLFCVYPLFHLFFISLVYIIVLHIACYYTFFRIVIYSMNKYFIKSSFLQSVH